MLWKKSNRARDQQVWRWGSAFQSTWYSGPRYFCILWALVGDSTISTITGPCVLGATALAGLLAAAEVTGIAWTLVDLRSPRHGRPQSLPCQHASLLKGVSSCWLRARCHLKPRCRELECRELALRKCVGHAVAALHMSLENIGTGNLFVQEGRRYCRMLSCHAAGGWLQTLVRSAQTVRQVHGFVQRMLARTNSGHRLLQRSALDNKQSQRFIVALRNQCSDP